MKEAKGKVTSVRITDTNFNKLKRVNSSPQDILNMVLELCEIKGHKATVNDLEFMVAKFKHEYREKIKE